MPNPYGPELGPITNWGDYYARQSRIPWPRQTGPAAYGPAMPGTGRAERETVRQATIQGRETFADLMKQPVKARKVKKPRLKKPTNPLLDYQRETSKIAQPDLERILAQDIKKEPVREPVRDVPSRKATPRARPGAMAGRAAAKRVAGKLLSKAIPVYGQLSTAADLARGAVSVAEYVQDAAMRRALGQMVYPTAGKRSTGPKTRAKRKPKTQTQPWQQTVPGPVKVTGTRTATVTGIQSPEQMLGQVPDFAKQAEREAKKREQTEKKRKAQLKREAKQREQTEKKKQREQERQRKAKERVEARNRRAYERARAQRIKAEQRAQRQPGVFGSAPGTVGGFIADVLGGPSGILGSLAGPGGLFGIGGPGGLTGSRKPGVGSSAGNGQDKCQQKPDPCKSAAARRAAGSRKRRLRSKDRICYAGTWRDTRKGRVILTDKRIPCQ